MDLLREEAARKRKAKGIIDGGNAKRQETEKPTSSAAEKLKLIEDLRSGRVSVSSGPAAPAEVIPSTANTGSVAAATIPEKEVMRRLRQRSQPITLFGEDEQKRAARLAALEEREPMEYVAGAGNDILKMLREMERSDEPPAAAQASAAQHQKHETDDKKGPEEGARAFFLELLREWEEYLAAVSPAEKQKTQSERLALATFRQCKENLAPFFDLLSRHAVPQDIVDHVTAIVGFLRQREYVKANDEYLRMSIGNAPWPMGVTMVGIHERSAREKISSQSVAHILNDETTRKYLQSIKRLMTFCQARHPTDPSKSVEWNALSL